MQFPLLDLFIVPCNFLKLILGFLARAFLLSDLLFEGVGEGKKGRNATRNPASFLILTEGFNQMQPFDLNIPNETK